MTITVLDRRDGTADTLPETLMPHKALDLEAQKRAAMDAMLRDASK